MQNTISEFDFRCYLFARQCQLLGRLHKPVEICRRAQIFISTFSRAIKEHQANVGEYFLESWIFSSCMSVVNECEELAPLTSMDSPNTIAFNAAKGELLDLARKQVDYFYTFLGVLFGLIWCCQIGWVLQFNDRLSILTLPCCIRPVNNQGTRMKIDLKIFITKCPLIVFK